MKAQLRWNDGQIAEYNLNDAWKMFMDDKEVWKISWSCYGKRLRIVKEHEGLSLGASTFLRAAYIEDEMEEALNEDEKA